MDFSGKVVLVTGAAVGIGRETAVAFAAHGAKVVINYSRSEKEARETLAMVEKAGSEGAICQADVSKEESAKPLIDFVMKTFGRLDILVNNAGITRFIPHDDMDAVTTEVWDALFHTNVESMFFVSREASKVMGEGSAIINLASIAGLRPFGSSIPYSVSKIAIIQLTRLLARVLAPKIRVCAVSPGVIENTRWFDNSPDFNPETMREKNKKTNLLGRMGQPEEVAKSILFLASEDSSFTTGCNLAVEGGQEII